MQIQLLPTDIIKRCCWDSFVYYIVGSDKEAEKMFKDGYQYKKAGVMLSEITPCTYLQMDMWEPKTQERLIARAGGKPTELVPSTMSPLMKDAERHATQARLAQQQGGVRKEPVIITKTTQGWDLIEGWHRTIQHFAQYPEGYTGPAYVAVSTR